MNTEKIFHKTLAIIFIAMTIIVMVSFFASKKMVVNKVENRTLAEFPEFNIKKLDKFPTDFDLYFTDHFPKKNELMKIISHASLWFFRISTRPDLVVIGSDGWFFMANTQLDGYTGKTQFSNKELDSLLTELNYRRNYCDSIGAKFYFVIIPLKHSVYPEFLPIRFRITGKESLREQTKNFLDKNNFPYIDPTDFVRSKKNDSLDLYFKTDDHWNYLGGFFGTQFILETIKKDFPQVYIPKITDYDIVRKELWGGDLVQMLSLQDEILELKTELVPKSGTKAKDCEHIYPLPKTFPFPWDYENRYEKTGVNNLKVYIVRESFGSYQRDFYKEAFGSTVLTFDEWKHQLNKKILLNEKPDIVIIQVLESLIPSIIQFPSETEPEK